MGGFPLACFLVAPTHPPLQHTHTHKPLCGHECRAQRDQPRAADGAFLFDPLEFCCHILRCCFDLTVLQFPGTFNLIFITGLVTTTAFRFLRVLGCIQIFFPSLIFLSASYHCAADAWNPVLTTFEHSLTASGSQLDLQYSCPTSSTNEISKHSELAALILTSSASTSTFIVIHCHLLAFCSGAPLIHLRFFSAKQIRLYLQRNKVAFLFVAMCHFAHRNVYTSFCLMPVDCLGVSCKRLRYASLFLFICF